MNRKCRSWSIPLTILLNPVIHQIIDTPSACFDLGVLCAFTGPESIVPFPWRQKGDGRPGRDVNALLLTLTRKTYDIVLACDFANEFINNCWGKS